MAGEEAAHKYKTSLYLVASASAEFIADIGLCPFEAVKVRMQTTIPPFATGTLNGINKVTSTEGVAGYASHFDAALTIPKNQILTTNSQIVQRAEPTLGPSDPIYHDEVSPYEFLLV